MLDANGCRMTTGHDSQAEDPTGAGAPGGARSLAGRIRRLLRYTGVNLVSLALDYAVFLSMMAAFELPVIASTIAYAVAFTLNYKLSRLFVFGSDGSHKGERRLFTEFMATGLLGIVLTATVTGAGVYLLDLAPIVAKTVAVLVSFVVLYLVRSRLVFTPLA